MKHKIMKGEFGYIPSQKKAKIAKTIFLFLLALSIYIMGYISTKTKSNLLTIVAMLGMLPASKSAVEMILFLRQKNGNPISYERIKEHANDLFIAYELVLTSYEKNYAITSIAVNGNTVCGFTEDSNCPITDAEKHISDILKKNGFKPDIKIFKELEKYTNRLDSLKKLEPKDTDYEILEVIKAISI